MPISRIFAPTKNGEGESLMQSPLTRSSSPLKRTRAGLGSVSYASPDQYDFHLLVIDGIVEQLKTTIAFCPYKLVTSSTLRNQLTMWNFTFQAETQSLDNGNFCEAWERRQLPDVGQLEGLGPEGLMGVAHHFHALFGKVGCDRRRDTRDGLLEINERSVGCVPWDPGHSGPRVTLRRSGLDWATIKTVKGGVTQRCR